MAEATGSGGAQAGSIQPSKTTNSLTPGTSTSPTLIYQGYTNYIAQVFLGDVIGSTPVLPNALDSSALDVAIITNPETIDAIRGTISNQLNAQAAEGYRFPDLSERIADVVIDTTAQGASTLEVHLIDPYWVIPNHSGLVRADSSGYLFPVDINFPTHTNCWWRLVQYRPSWRPEMPSANLVLTFEDRIVSLLRLISPGTGGKAFGEPNQTLSQFFAELVSITNSILKPNPPITYVPLVDPNDPNYEPVITSLPSRVQRKLAHTGITTVMSQLIHEWSQILSPLAADETIGNLEQLIAKKVQKLHGSDASPWIAPSKPGAVIQYR